MDSTYYQYRIQPSITHITLETSSITKMSRTRSLETINELHLEEGLAEQERLLENERNNERNIIKTTAQIHTGATSSATTTTTSDTTSTTTTSTRTTATTTGTHTKGLLLKESYQIM